MSRGNVKYHKIWTQDGGGGIIAFVLIAVQRSHQKIHRHGKLLVSGGCGGGGRERGT